MNQTEAKAAAAKTGLAKYKVKAAEASLKYRVSAQRLAASTRLMDESPKKVGLVGDSS